MKDKRRGAKKRLSEWQKKILVTLYFLQNVKDGKVKKHIYKLWNESQKKDFVNYYLYKDLAKVKLGIGKTTFRNKLSQYFSDRIIETYGTHVIDIYSVTLSRSLRNLESKKLIKLFRGERRYIKSIQLTSKGEDLAEKLQQIFFS